MERWYANPNGFTLLLLQCQCINKGNNPTYDLAYLRHPNNQLNPS
jgi:hypothetical protein